MKIAMSSLGMVVICLVLGQILAAKEEDFEPVRKMCLERNNITDEEFKALTEEKAAEGIESKFKCFAHCLADEMGYLDEMGKVNVKKIEEEVEIGEKEMAKMLECRDKHDAEDDPCEYSFLILACVMGIM